jgi:hypothetical protein
VELVTDGLVLGLVVVVVNDSELEEVEAVGGLVVATEDVVVVALVALVEDVLPDELDTLVAEDDAVEERVVGEDVVRELVEVVFDAEVVPEELVLVRVVEVFEVLVLVENVVLEREVESVEVVGVVTTDVEVDDVGLLI